MVDSKFVQFKIIDILIFKLKDININECNFFNNFTYGQEQCQWIGVFLSWPAPQLLARVECKLPYNLETYTPKCMYFMGFKSSYTPH